MIRARPAQYWRPVQGAMIEVTLINWGRCTVYAKIVDLLIVLLTHVFVVYLPSMLRFPHPPSAAVRAIRPTVFCSQPWQPEKYPV